MIGEVYQVSPGVSCYWPSNSVVSTHPAKCQVRCLSNCTRMRETGSSLSKTEEPSLRDLGNVAGYRSSCWVNKWFSCVSSN